MNNKKKNYLPKLSLYIRVAVGAFLIYEAYGISGGISKYTGKDFYVLGTFVILFAIIGVFFIISGGLHLLKGEYEGGKADNNETDAVDDKTSHNDDEQ